MKIYLATGNKNKKRELQELLPNHTIVIPSDENIQFNPDENGTTFYENSLIKAKALFDIVHMPVIADDSGICVDALSGKPGIYSARYAGPSFMEGTHDGKKISQDEQNKFLIEQLNSVVKTSNFPPAAYIHGKRSCHYTCAMVLYLGTDRIFVCEETFEGTLIDNIENSKGNGGFGYDPIVYLPELSKTVAELSADQKNAISHRGKAMNQLKKIIDSL